MTGYPFLFINSFINLRGPEGVGNVVFVHVEVSFVHLHLGPTSSVRERGGRGSSPGEQESGFQPARDSSRRR
jgi:hypothetical protein